MIGQVASLADVDLTIEEKSNKMKRFSYDFVSRFLCLRAPMQNTGDAVFDLFR